MNFQKTINVVLMSPNEEFCYIFGELDTHVKVKSVNFEVVRQIPSDLFVFSAIFDATKKIIFMAGNTGCIIYVDADSFEILG